MFIYTYLYMYYFTRLWDIHKNPLGYAPNQTSPLLTGTVFYLSFTILSCFYNLWYLHIYVSNFFSRFRVIQFMFVYSIN